MISNKTAATLCIAISSMKLVASTSPDVTQRPSASVEPTLKTRKQRPASKVRKIVPKLRDTTTEIVDVQPMRENVKEMDNVKEQPAPQINKQFEGLIIQRKFREIFVLGGSMSADMFLEEILPIVRTPKQYRGLAKYLKRRGLIPHFYVHGDMRVVRRAIIAKSKIYDDIENAYVKDGDLETALFLALEKDCHDRVIELLDVRKGITAEMDEQSKRGGIPTSFGYFVFSFLHYLAPWKDGMAVKRFLTLREGELRDEHSDIIDTFTQLLIIVASDQLDELHARKFITDLIGQSSLLTPVTFAKGFLFDLDDEDSFDLIDYAWREAIEECLKKECENGGEKLWQAMTRERPNRFSGDYPDNPDAFAAVLAKFPTKQELEAQWIEKNASSFFEELKRVITAIFPVVLVHIVTEYARPTWIDVLSLKAS